MRRSGTGILSFTTLEVVFTCDPNSFIGHVLVGIDAGQLPVQLLLELVVEKDTANLAARKANFLGNFVIKAVEIGVVADFLRLDQAVVDRLPIGNKMCSLNKPVAVLRQCQNSG